MAPMDRVQPPQGYRAATRRQFTLTTKSPRVPDAHLIHLGRIKG